MKDEAEYQFGEESWTDFPIIVPKERRITVDRTGFISSLICNFQNIQMEGTIGPANVWVGPGSIPFMQIKLQADKKEEPWCF